MTRDLVIGLDCSTTATKAVVWDANGRALSIGRAGFSTTTPHPGWGEQNPEDWWSTTREAVRRAVQAVDARRVAALAITHQRETFACTTEDGRPLRPAMLWLDTRATEEVATFGTREVHEITGKPPNPTPAWYKLLWLARHEPATLRRTERVADVGAYLVRRLTGEWATSWASADPLGLVDLRTFDYDDMLLQTAQLDRDRMPTLHPPGTVLGQVSVEIADQLGLPRGLPVVAGAGDGQAAGLGTGVVEPGSSYLNLGSGIISGSASGTYRFSDAFRTMAGGVPGTYAVETFIGGGTHNISWFVERFAGVDTRALGLDLTAEQVLETAAAQLPPGAEGLLTLPYWTGALTPYWDHHARGTILGLTGRHGKSHVYRSLLEGLALEQRLLTDGAEVAVGVPVDRVVATGGGSRSPVWCQIMADVLRRPLHIAREAESTCLGAGVLAAAAVGLHPSVAEASSAMSGTRTVYHPDSEDSAVYERLFGVYRRLYPQLREVFHDLAEALAPPGAGADPVLAQSDPRDPVGAAR